MLVIVRKQSDVDSGDIVVIPVNGTMPPPPTHNRKERLTIIRASLDKVYKNIKKLDQMAIWCGFFLGAGEGNRAVVHSPAFREFLPLSRCACHLSFFSVPASGFSSTIFRKKRNPAYRPGCFFWSGRGESNPRHQLGKLMFYH